MDGVCYEANERWRMKRAEIDMTATKDACFEPDMLSVEQAQSFLLEAARPLAEVENVQITESLGRVLAAAQVSPIDVPGYDNSAMDGYAVRSEDVAPSGVTKLSISQRIVAGTEGSLLNQRQAARIFTGAPMPSGADAVIMQERCRVEGGLLFSRGRCARGRTFGLREMTLPGVLRCFRRGPVFVPRRWDWPPL